MKNLSKLFLTIILANISILIHAQIPDYLPNEGLVGWFPFNGDGNDKSNYGANGTFEGGTFSTDRFGLNNMAYSFDGIDDVFMVNRDLSDFSISLWIKPTKYSSNPGNNIFNYECSYAEVLKSDSTLYARKQSISGNSQEVLSKYFISLNQWHHLVFNFNISEEKVSVFINNENVFSSTVAYQGTCEAEKINDIFYFGGIKLNGKSFFTGIIDDIGIWNRMLTENEVKDLYHGSICYQTATVTDTLIINYNIIAHNPVLYDRAIKIYPNPTNDMITIDYGNNNENAYEISIINSLGEVVFSSLVNNEKSTVDLSSWKGKGLYYVKLINNFGKTVETRKIILQ